MEDKKTSQIYNVPVSDAIDIPFRLRNDSQRGRKRWIQYLAYHSANNQEINRNNIRPRIRKNFEINNT